MSLRHLMGGLQHFHEEGVDGRVPNELEEKQVFETLEADGSERGQSQQQLRKPVSITHTHTQ